MATEKIFEVTMPADAEPEKGFELIRKKANGVGITLDGDSDHGTFSGTAEGAYQRDGDRLRFEVQKKPFFVSWSMVENGMRKIFGEVTVS